MLQRLAVAFLSIAFIVPACEKPAPPPEDGKGTPSPATEAAASKAASSTAGSEGDPETPGTSPAASAKGTLPSGVGYTILKSGTGRSPRVGSTVRVHLTGWLANGNEFLNTRSDGKPETYRVDKMVLIPGLFDTLLQMKEGEQRRIHVPSSEAYSATGYTGVVPPNTDLDFNVELVSVES